MDGNQKTDGESPYTNSVFEQPWWLELVAPGKWKETLIEEKGEIVGRFVYVYDKGKIYMPELTQTLGPWICERYRQFQAGNRQFGRQKEIISEMFSQLPEYKSFNMVFDSANEYILPYRWLGFHYSPAFSYRINDLSDIDVLYSRLHKTAKKNIKSARNKTEIVVEDSPDNILNLLDKTYEAQSRRTPGDREFKEMVINGALARGKGKVILAKDADGNLHSGAFLLYDEKVCYYLLGGSDSAYRSSGAQSLVLWEAINFASKVSKAFDFEGSNVESIEKFFRQFGGSIVTNYRIVRQPLIFDCLDLAKPRIKKIVGYKN